MPSDTTPATASSDEPATRVEPPRGDVYATVRRFAPVLVVLFCVGLLVAVAVLRPFESPPAAPELRDALIGADADPTAAYVVIHNVGGNDTLLSVSTPAATTVELQQRQRSSDDDPGELVTVDRMDVPGFEDTSLVPGGDQLLLRGLTGPIAAGDRVPLTFEFERAGEVTVEAEVRPYLDIADQLLPPRLVLPGQDA